MTRYWYLIWFIIGVTVGLLIPTQAQGRGHMCKTREYVGDRLSKVFNEETEYIALSTDGRVLEVFTSPDGGSYTIMLTDVEGKSCILDAGEAWEKVKRVKKGRGT